jgi:eukaryotic-like serine/threonine-protein kinase
MIDPGTLIDRRYEVLERVGSGGMADVYLAQDKLLGRKVAVKVLHHRFAEDQEFVERFKREASSAAGLSHPNVVSVFDRGEWDGTYYIAMEYLPGRTLKAIVRERGPLEPAAAIDVTVQILRAARFAHRRGVIHRDLKPHNVILDEEGRAKVTDFGIARAGASDMTLTGSIMGTAQYLSPEQAQGHAVTEPSDLYAIGVVLYELLTGKVPFEGETAVTIALQHISQPPPPPSQANPAVPAALDAVVLRALQKNPAERYQTADELIAALEQVRSTLPKPRDEHALAGAGAAAGLAAAGLVQPGLGSLRQPQPAAAAAGSWQPSTGRLAPYDPARGASAAGAGATENGEGPPEGERDRRRKQLLWGLLALLIAGVAIALILLLSPARRVSVPGVEGMSKSAAVAKLHAAGLKWVASYATSTGVLANHVVSQKPGKGSEVKPHSTVSIVISLGAGSATVPKVVGLTEEEALNKINASGLSPKPTPQHSETVKSGHVISTSPVAGRSLERGKTVLVMISSGPLQVKVPSVVGESRESAEATLEEAGLSIVQVRERSHEGAAAGTVIEQSPHAGRMVSKGTGIALVVAKAKSHTPAKVVVPSVVEDGRESALATLRAAGLKPEILPETVSEASRIGFVIKQAPQAGTNVAKGATVKIYVGAESTTTTSTTSTGASSTSSSTSSSSTQAAG